MRKVIAPILDEVMGEFKEKVKLGKINVEENIKTASLFRIREVPTLLFFRNGVVVDYLTGIFRKKELKTHLYTLLGKGKK